MSYCCKNSKTDDEIPELFDAVLEIESLRKELEISKGKLKRAKEWEDRYQQKWNLAEKQLTRQADILKEYESEIRKLGSYISLDLSTNNYSPTPYILKAASIAKKLCIFEKQLSIPETQLLAKAYLDITKANEI